MVFLLLGACGADVQVGYETAPCEDWNFETSESVVEVEQVDAGYQIARLGVTKGCDARFVPEFDANGYMLVIYEFWENAASDDCEACWSPTVILYDPPAGDYDLYWYDESSAVVPVWSEQLSL